jgi:hypothetical protein
MIMSETLFWKPGSNKPINGGDKKGEIGRNGRNRNGSVEGHRQRNESELPAQPNASAGASSGSGNTPLRKTKLSGTTMNMRFMMRKQPQQDSDTSKPLTSPQHANTPDRQPRHSEAQSSNQSEQDPVFINIIGRRSFGGFNRHTENAWNEHASFYGTKSSRNPQGQGNAQPSPQAKKKRKRQTR